MEASGSDRSNRLGDLAAGQNPYRPAFLWNPSRVSVEAEEVAAVAAVAAAAKIAAEVERRKKVVRRKESETMSSPSGRRDDGRANRLAC